MKLLVLGDAFLEIFPLLPFAQGAIRLWYSMRDIKLDLHWHTHLAALTQCGRALSDRDRFEEPLRAVKGDKEVIQWIVAAEEVERSSQRVRSALIFKLFIGIFLMCWPALLGVLEFGEWLSGQQEYLGPGTKPWPP